MRAALFIEEPEQNSGAERIAVSIRREAGIGDHSRGTIMKITTVAAIALGIGALAACNKSPQTQAADNYEANVDANADNMVANVDNAADNMTASSDNAADSMKDAAKNKADAMKDAADNKSDAMKNGH